MLRVDKSLVIYETGYDKLTFADDNLLVKYPGECVNLSFTWYNIRLYNAKPYVHTSFRYYCLMGLDCFLL